MPFKSKSQEKWMWANHPKIARQWEMHTPKAKPLPAKLKKTSSKRSK